jgi:hypothetical protein
MAEPEARERETLRDVVADHYPIPSTEPDDSAVLSCGYCDWDSYSKMAWPDHILALAAPLPDDERPRLDSGAQERLRAALDVDRLTATLRLIHGDTVPLPNRATPRDYAEVIARWYGSKDIDAALHDSASSEETTDD